MAQEFQEVFEPQTFIMKNWKWFVNYSIERDTLYKHLMPIRANNPFDVNQKFLGTDNVKTLMNIPNGTLVKNSVLEPQINLYKVFPDGEEIRIGTTIHKAEEGQQKTDGSWDVETFSGGETGDLASILEFSWKREGQTTAEWKSHITAELKIFLRNPADLNSNIATYKNGKEYKVKYLDLLYREKPTVASQSMEGAGVPYAPEAEQPFSMVPAEQTANPDYFQIKVVIDYLYNPPDIPGEYDLTESQVLQIEKLYRNLGTTIYLNIHNHDIDFASSTSDVPPMIITANYIGHVSNVLSQIGTFQKTEENAINPYGGIILENYRFLMEDMMTSEKLYVSAVKTDIDTETIKNKDGEDEEIKTAKFVLAGSPGKADPEKTKEQELATLAASKEDGAVDTGVLAEKMKGLRTSQAGFNLKWFYFGDLMDIVLGSAYNDLRSPHRAALNNIRFLVGPMIIRDKNNQRYSVNICDLPIALETFMLWFQEKIINQKIKKLSVSAFLRSAFNSLIRGVYGPMARRDPEFKSPALSFTTFSLPTKNNVDQVFLDKIPGQGFSIRPKQVMSIDKLQTYTEDENEKSIHYYLIYSANESRFSFQSTMDEDDDSKKGIAHVNDVTYGPVENIKFKKIDVPGFGAANILRAGKGQGILRGLYNADLKLSGYPIFHPGMLIFINPEGLGLGNITASNSLSKKLGMGGYYTIRSASFRYSGTELKGDLDCWWQTFGEINSNSTITQFGIAGLYGSWIIATPTMEKKL